MRIKTVETTERDLPDSELNGSKDKKEEEKVENVLGSTVGVPLFPDLDPKDVKTIEVHRLVPSMGLVGEVDPSASLMDVARMYGGKRLLLKAISAIGHKYLKQRTEDVGFPPRKPGDDEEDGDHRYEDELSVLKDGMLSIDSKLDRDRDGDGKRGVVGDLVQIAIARSDTEREMARLQLEQAKSQNTAHIEELRIKQEEDRNRFQKEMEFKQKEIDAKLELEKQKLEVEKQKIESDRIRMKEDAEARRSELQLKLEQDDKRRQDEITRLEREAKEERAALEQRMQQEADRRKEDLERLEAQRKHELDMYKADQKDREERDRQWRAAEAERSEKFQVMMANLAKGSDTSKMAMEFLQTGMELVSNNKDDGDSEEKDPMAKLVSKIPDVIDLVMTSRLGGGNGLMSARQQQLPAPQQQVAPAVQQSTAIPMHSKRRGKGGKKVAKVNNTQQAAPKPAPGAQAAQKPMPQWAQLLSFSLKHLSVETMGEIVLDLNDPPEGVQVVISDDIMNRILNGEESLLKAYLGSISKAFVHPAVWEKIKAVKTYMIEVLSEDSEDEGEEEAPADESGFDLGIGADVAQPAEETPAEPAKAEAQTAEI